jgi:single-stranded-DNA-specific exonuclease
VIYASMVGTGHVRCTLAGTGGARIQAIAFRAADTPLGRALLTIDGPPLHLAGTVRLDAWQGQVRVQLAIEDGARAGG